MQDGPFFAAIAVALFCLYRWHRAERRAALSRQCWSVSPQTMKPLSKP